MIQVTVEYVLRPGAEEKFEQALSRMQERVKGFDGYLGEELCQSTAEDGKFVTIFYWRDRETMAAWRQDPEHLKVQQLGREEIFAWYRIRVAEVEREYGSDEPASSVKLRLEKLTPQLCVLRGREPFDQEIYKSPDFWRHVSLM